MHDVYAYGVIAPSTLIELVDEFPGAGGYAEIATVHPSMGGEAAGGAYVLARLGVATKLAGNRLGDDDSSARVREALSAAGVDCSAIELEPDTSPVIEVVVAGGAARTVFGTYRRLASDQAWNDPSRDDVRSSRIVCLDPFFADASRQVADWCVEAGVPYVTVDVAPDSEIARHAQVLIISEEFTGRTLSTTDAHEVVADYVEHCSGLVTLTRGGRRLISARRGEPSRGHEPFTVDMRDTTGAGDSFRAGIIYGMLRGYADDDLVRTASALAAMVCERVPGVLNSPTETELIAFLDRHVP
jgi:sugar/nucleoside kinase (ribokinase family)